MTAILILIAAAGLVLFGIGTADPNHPAHPQAVEDLLPVRTYLRPAASWAVLVVVLLASACLAAIWFIRILSGVRRRIMRLILGGLLLGGAFVAFPVLLFPLVMTLDVGTEVSAGSRCMTRTPVLMRSRSRGRPFSAMRRSRSSSERTVPGS